MAMSKTDAVPKGAGSKDTGADADEVKYIYF